MKNTLTINHGKSAVILFAKYPIAGKVKTRLAAETGNEFALEFYKNCAAHIFDEAAQLKKLGIDCYLFYGTEDNSSEVKKWIGESFIYCPQTNGDLGEKISSAFRNVFAHGKNKVLIAGTDVPDITKDDFLKVFKELERNPVVISPSNDGGYNILGMNNYYPEIFKDIKWSTEEVFRKTIEAVNNLGLNNTVTKNLIDIDTKEDLYKWLSDAGIGNTKLKLFTKKIL